MEGIQGLRQQTTAPVQRAISQSAETKKNTVSARTDSFQSMLTEAERAEQAAKTPELPNFAKMTDKQKLSALVTLHDATDYSGMTDVEKYKLMNDRFEAAFPYLGAYESGLIGRDSVHYFGTNNMGRPVQGMASQIQRELSRQWNSQGLKEISKLHREAYYGGMSDGKTAQAVAKRHSGGNFAAQASVLQELKNLGLGDQEKIQETLTNMRAKLVQWVTGAKTLKNPPILETDNATQEAAVYAMATGGQVRSGGGTDWGALKRLLAESADDWDQKIVNGYSQYVQSVIDSIVDEVVRGEDQSPDPAGKLTKEPAAVAAAE